MANRNEQPLLVPGLLFLPPQVHDPPVAHAPHSDPVAPPRGVLQPGAPLAHPQHSPHAAHVGQAGSGCLTSTGQGGLPSTPGPASQQRHGLCSRHLQRAWGGDGVRARANQWWLDGRGHAVVPQPARARGVWGGRPEAPTRQWRQRARLGCKSGKGTWDTTLAPLYAPPTATLQRLRRHVFLALFLLSLSLVAPLCQGAAHHSAAGAAGGAEAHAPGAGPSRSRGQQIIAHLELYILRAVHGSHGTSTGLAVPPGGGGSGSGGTGPLDMLTGERTSPSDLPTLSGRGGGGGGGGLPSTSGMHNRPASGASSTQYGLATRSRPVSASVAAAAAAALAGAAPSGGRAHPAACRTPGSLISAVCGMELLDLRGIPFPSWWARGQLYRPPCVMVDNAQVYDEPPAGAAAGAGGGRGGMELPPHVARTLEAGLSQGLVVLDLNVSGIPVSARGWCGIAAAMLGAGSG